jgi:hypothetical protein
LKLAMLRPLLLIGTPALALVAYVYLHFAGSAVVADETGGVMSAAITSASGEQPLVRLWSGYFYAIPNQEGLIEIRCIDGSRKRWGYVTRYLSTKIRVVGDRPCARIVEVF